MTIRLKTAFFITTGIILMWFLYIERAVLTPFILAAIFAYIFNPFVNFFTHKIRLPRTLSVIVIYAILISLISVSAVVFSGRIVEESSEIQSAAKALTITAKSQVSNIPQWLQPTVNDTLQTFEKYQTLSYPSAFEFLPKAVSRILGFIIFLFAAFYFLKEGRSMFDKLLAFIPPSNRVEADILIRRMNGVLSGYLRGQIFLVLFVATLLFLCLSILGVKFALILAIFSGFAEIVPYIGPITATAVAVIVAYFTGGSHNIALDPIQSSIAIIAIYFVLRQFQDYFVTPYVMGRITKLHPLVILFAVVAGEHIAGIMGLILAVPIAGILRVIFEYSIDRINDRDLKETKNASGKK